MKLKKLVTSFLILTMFVLTSMNSFAAGVDEETNEWIDVENVEVITREDYIQHYAQTHGVSYEQADYIDKQDNARIWNEYCERNNLPQPRQIIYESSYSEAGATIWYVSARKTYSDGIASLLYGAKGKIIQDTHTKTFVKNSFDGNRIFSPGSGVYTIDGDVYIDDNSYTRLYISVTATSSVGVNHTISVGGSGVLASLGYSQGTDYFWRKTIDDNFTETL